VIQNAANTVQIQIRCIAIPPSGLERNAAASQVKEKGKRWP
jgi:hypothetical protein